MASSGDGDAKPLIVVLTIDNSGICNDTHKDFLKLLETKAEVQSITTEAFAKAAFRMKPKPAAILCGDESLTGDKRVWLLHEALGYIRAGGTLIFMGCFSRFSQRPDMKHMFAGLGLPWRSGVYTKCNFELNRRMNHFDTKNLHEEYFMKAMHLASVEPEDAVYFPEDVRKDLQTPAAFAKFGEAHIGFVGDVNNEEGTTPLLLAMCGLSD